jgi:tol-pal system protein YbgF
MINCKKHFIAACFSLVIPTVCIAEAPVVDDSDNFAIIDEQQTAVRPQFEQPQIENAELDNPQNSKYQLDTAEVDDGPALAKDDTQDQNTRAQKYSHNNISDNAALIERVQTLQKEIQDLRGQLEVQAHELKTLKDQQLTFYKDLDSRIVSGKATATKPSYDVNATKVATPTIPTSQINKAVPVATNSKNSSTLVVPNPASTSRTNPADEQISYLAAYELVKNKRYDDGIKAMQSFVQKYPQGGYSANAQYWLGELFMVKKEYPKAIEHFDVVLHKFPSSSKSAASMLKAGYAYAASGNNQEAKKRLQEVIKTYPGTSTAQLASLKLESINAI